MKALDEIVNYYNVGLYPNLLGTYWTYQMIKDISEEKYICVIPNALMAGLSYAIGFQKYREYKQVKKSLIKHGWNEKIVKPKMYSWCQRYATRQAVKQTGNLKKFDEFAKKEGHKWYHFLPKIHRIGEVTKFR